MLKAVRIEVPQSIHKIDDMDDMTRHDIDDMTRIGTIS